MRTITSLLLATLAVIALPAAATSAPWPDGGRRTIRCESDEGKYAYCRTYTTGEIQLRRQLSKSPCQEYQTWGSSKDGSGVWVREGCRAEFAVRERHWGWDDDDRRGGDRGRGENRREARMVRCASTDFRYEHCPVPRGLAKKAQIARQLSDASCVRGSSWGVDRYGIWVDNGCEAEFAVN